MRDRSAAVKLLAMDRYSRLMERRAGRAVPDLGPPAALALFTIFVSPVAARAMPGTRHLDAAAFLLLAASALVLVGWRRLPLVAYLASVAFASLYLAAGYPTGPIVLAPLAGLLAVEVAAEARIWMPAAALGAAVLPLSQGVGGRWSWGLLVFALFWLAAAALFGVAVRLRRSFDAELQARLQLSERTKEEEARRKVAEERLRLAREVHDVVGHGLATISLQAGVAEHLLDSRPDEVRKAVAAIRTLSKQALAELRNELIQLRNADGIGPIQAPTPSFHAIPDVIASMREAGMAVSLEMEGGEPAMPEAIALAGYRIVQESLTNVVRHARADTHTQGRVVATQAALEIEVLDDGPGAPASAIDGNGVRGMRERAISLGGQLEVGNRASGGFRVWVLLSRTSG
jgi:signal transduction histidine kinase